MGFTVGDGACCVLASLIASLVQDCKQLLVCGQCMHTQAEVGNLSKQLVVTCAVVYTQHDRTMCYPYSSSRSQHPASEHIGVKSSQPRVQWRCLHENWSTPNGKQVCLFTGV